MFSTIQLKEDEKQNYGILLESEFKNQKWKHYLTYHNENRVNFNIPFGNEDPSFFLEIGNKMRDLSSKKRNGTIIIKFNSNGIYHKCELKISFKLGNSPIWHYTYEDKNNNKLEFVNIMPTTWIDVSKKLEQLTKKKNNKKE